MDSMEVMYLKSNKLSFIVSTLIHFTIPKYLNFLEDILFVDNLVGLLQNGNNIFVDQFLAILEQFDYFVPKYLFVFDFFVVVGVKNSDYFLTVYSHFKQFGTTSFFFF